MGYKPDYRRYSLGHNLFLHIIRQLGSEKKIKEIDFGFGDADYKREICNKHWFESSVYIFSPSLTGLFYNIFNTLNHVINTALVEVSKKLNIRMRIKRIWRDNLIKQAD